MSTKYIVKCGHGFYHLTYEEGGCRSGSTTRSEVDAKKFDTFEEASERATKYIEANRPDFERAEIIEVRMVEARTLVAIARVQNAVVVERV